MKIGGLAKDYGNVKPEVLEKAAARGTAVHKAIELLNDNDLDWDSLHPEIAPRVGAYQQFVLDSGWRHLHAEQMLYSHRGFAGQMDEIGMLNKKRTLLDFKSSYEKDQAAWNVQTQAYLELWNENHPEVEINACFALWLNRNGEYELIDTNDREGWAMFEHALAIAKWREKHGR